MDEREDREATIRRHLPIVRRIARRVHRLVAGVDLDDLVGDGSIGLIRAVDRYDPTRGPTLEQYARRLILGAMLNGIRRMDPVSERARRALRDGENERYRLAVERGSVPTRAEMEALRPGFERAMLAAHCGVPLSIDAPLPEGERMPRDWNDDPAGAIVRDVAAEALRTVIDMLPERQRSVVHAHYYGDRSLRDIGKRMGISPQRASQIHIAAIAKLKRALDAATP